jgi:hypothetical protein
LIAAGVELVEVSMLLGHSELRVTADLYSHLQKQTASKAARPHGRGVDAHDRRLEGLGCQMGVTAWDAAENCRFY